MIGKWIDGLSDVRKDRIVEATAWRAHSPGSADTPRCLIGHAYQITLKDVVSGHPIAMETATIVVSYRFDRLVARFGLDRIVRCVKLRAGATLPTGPRTNVGTPVKRVATSEAGGLPGVVAALEDV